MVKEIIKWKRLKEPLDLEKIEIGETIFARVIHSGGGFFGSLGYIGREDGKPTFIARIKKLVGPETITQAVRKLYITPDKICVDGYGMILQKLETPIACQDIRPENKEYEGLVDKLNSMGI